MTTDPDHIFERCSEVWGTATVRNEKIQSRVYKDVFYLPFSPTVFFDRYADWGLYDRDGYLIADAAYRRHGELIGQQPRVDLGRFEFAECGIRPLRYGGLIIPHYGHFLLSSIARHWDMSDDGVTVFHSDPPFGDHRSPYIRDICRAMGLGASNAISFHSPTRIKEISIAEPSFQEQGYIYPILRDVGLNIGKSLSDISDQFYIDEGAHVFLSKSLVTSGVTHFSNEAALENLLHEAGFSIVHPQTLSVSEQVQIFKSAEVIVGFEGSAFHTQVLHPQSRARRLVLSPTGYVNSNFILLDAIWQNQATYGSLRDQVEINDAPTSHFRSYTVKDVEALAGKICAWTGPPPRRPARPGTLSVRRHADNLDNLQGEDFRSLVKKIRDAVKPSTYLEIGTVQGDILKMFDCRSLAIDPAFAISQDVIGPKPICSFYQMPSDDFFECVDPRHVLDGPIEFAFLDGLHQCEALLRDFLNTERFCNKTSVILLHDCVPVELPMTSRIQNSVPAEDPARGGWWTGDVWKTALTLKEHRRDLDIFTIDAQPTGLVVITNLSPGNAAWRDEYDRLLPIMQGLECSLREVHARLQVHATSELLPELQKARSTVVASAIANRL